MSRQKRHWILLAAAILLNARSCTGELRELTLQEAVQLAVSQNRALKIARLKVKEAQQRKAEQRSSYFPSVTDHAKADANTGVDHVAIPAGAVGSVNGTLAPDKNINLPQGRRNLLLNTATVSQPLTQLIRIHQANLVATAEVSISLDELKKAEDQVALDVHNLYFEILIARLESLILRSGGTELRRLIITMFRIEKRSEGGVTTLRISGRVESEQLPDLRAHAIGSEGSEPR